MKIYIYKFKKFVLINFIFNIIKLMKTRLSNNENIKL